MFDDMSEVTMLCSHRLEKILFGGADRAIHVALRYFRIVPVEIRRAMSGHARVHRLQEDLLCGDHQCPTTASA
ncbi:MULTISPECIES: hypothetical protein [Bradyrhizobium]|jgi:hypothetical protein|uniref:Uncharacterized protein n=1 Tax=Bradyrhizobium japonicum TaxID=375 RepID=A0ABV2RQ35_BRAJP|nr:hypothetical protein [Bradyrhizobium japonicum]MBR0766182.1 hypothetical protein [Bradyrhizobium japonicum]MCS3989729.1 hypothetical protein [Bradyrhizobium japonicum]MDH6178845.1 hypothetical protein [Bradyrhizobium japonicum]MYV82304.1 hypothetical protein [Bradyrhizobium japonicum]UQD98068.1 hypothetical protein JEY30_42690 [Bradyrhizobium japonicum]